MADNDSLNCSTLSEIVHEQAGSTCYAHAIATVIASAERRIVGRKPKDHDVIVDEIIKRHGSNGGYPRTVLSEECIKRGLGSSELLSTKEIVFWVMRGHAILAAFSLEENQWNDLSKFLKDQPNEILTWKHISQPEIKYDESYNQGHVVVIGGYNQRENYWIIKNSWGKKSAHKGYWKVSADGPLKFTYYHVYFLIEDLKFDDLLNYIKEYGMDSETKEELVRRSWTNPSVWNLLTKGS